MPNYKKSLDSHPLWQIYDKWYENNKYPILKGKWKLAPEDLLNSPEKDEQRGLNLISYLDTEANRHVDEIVNKFKVFSKSSWKIPKEARHITVHDMIPHNAGISQKVLVKRSNDYKRVIQDLVQNSDYDIKIAFSGVFASPDGITLQGFPLGDDLQRLREDLRKMFEHNGLVNLEEKKYIIKTAHVALIKFISPLNGKQLLKIVDKLRKTTPVEYGLDSLVLNISSRYDKSRTIEVIKKWNI